MNRISFSSSYFFPTILKEINQISKVQSRIKPLSNRVQSKGGRLNGTIIAPRRNNYIRRLYRYIDFQRSLNTIHSGIILQNIYDPNRTANLCLICYPSGFFSYILQPAKVVIGDSITNNAVVPINNGDSASLHNIRSGRLIHNIQGKFTRSAGCSTILVRKDYDQALLKLKSGELRFFHTSVIASLGLVGNENYFLRTIRKAGTSRYLGRRPRTRPSSMNPVDHPMGGRTRGGCQPCNIKGLITLNRSTVKKHHSNILYTKRQLKLLRQ